MPHSEEPPTENDYQSVYAALAALEQDGWRKATLNEQVTAWAALVTSVEEGYSMSVEEYTNDLRVRTWLERAGALLTPRLQASLAARLAPLDDRFRRATVVPAGHLPGAGDEWWYRLPKVLVDELAEDARAMGLAPGEAGS